MAQEATTPQESVNGQEGGNGDIKVLREKAKNFDALTEQFKGLQAQFAELKEKADVLEREKMTDQERIQQDLAAKDKKIQELTGQIGELHPFKEKVSQWGETFQSLYESKLGQVPEAVRPKIQKLSENGDWPQRLTLLEEAITLIPTSEPSSTGFRGSPSAGQGSSPDKPKAITVEEAQKNPSAAWAQAFGKSA